MNVDIVFYQAINHIRSKTQSFWSCGSLLACGFVSCFKVFGVCSYLSWMCAIQCPVWNLSDSLPCCSFLKAFGVLFRVRYMYTQLGGELQNLYTTLLDPFFVLYPPYALLHRAFISLHCYMFPIIFP